MVMLPLSQTKHIFNLLKYNIMANLKKQYRDLEKRVLSELRGKVNSSNVYSKHLNGKCIKVNIFDYTELAIIHDSLTFLDDRGYQYNIFNGCSLEDLIDILNKSNGYNME